MKTLKVEIEGIVPLLLCNPRLSNPLDPETKAHKKISGKRKKTDEDYEWLAQHEWDMALYLNEDQEVILPDLNIEACIINGAKDNRRGTQFKSSLLISESAKLKNPSTGRYYKFDTIRKDEKHYDTRMVKVKLARIMRTRPVFNEWGAEFEVHYDENILDEGEVKDAIRIGGALKAIGDYRPKFGKFKVVSIN